MSGVTTFRSQCKLCDEIFFVPFKDALYCPRCAKRIGYRYPRPAAVERPAAAPPSAGVPATPPRQDLVTGSSDAAPGGSQSAAAHAESESTSPPASDASKDALRASPPPRPVVAHGAPARSPHSVAEAAALAGAAPPARRREFPASDTRGMAARGPGSRPGADRPGGSRTGAGGRDRGAVRRSESGRAPARDAAASGEAAVPPPPVKITESLRRSIEHAYEYHAGEPDITLKEIIDRICLEFGLDRRTVHEVASQAHTAHLRKQVHEATAQQRDNIAKQYEQMVFQGLRPEEGRRRVIARQVGLPIAAVTSAINHWSWRHTDPRQLSRQDKFRIEQAFWNVAHTRAPEESTPTFDEVVRRVADLVNLPLFGVARWIDQLHDDPRLHLHVPPAPSETVAALETAYQAYLAAPEPPPDSLHRTLAEQHGCTIRQAHRTLLLFRWKERLRLLQTRPDQQAMVQLCTQPPAQAPDAGQPGTGSPVNDAPRDDASRDDASRDDGPRAGGPRAEGLRDEGSKGLGNQR